MGSIFTFGTGEQRVSSPWLHPQDPGKKPSSPVSASASAAGGERMGGNEREGTASPDLLSEYGVTKLMAEPQDGPTEYKLHLLLRPRRTFVSMSTTDSPDPRAKAATPLVLSSSNQSRQSRLQHLTTQLLWRLQQSSPFHSSTAKDLVLPRLPDAGSIRLAAATTGGGDAAAVAVANKPGRLVPGLEESRGALYEIGVSDDGTLVGLSKDEMDESITTLRIMAASLGCRVEILRMIVVGECRWIAAAKDGGPPETRQGKLWVAEALVAPDLIRRNHDSLPESSSESSESSESSSAAAAAAAAAEAAAEAAAAEAPSRGCSTTDQLRITLTGPTTSGKSTLLGTLSTGTLDNGRGKSRLSTLKHRHEVASGVTSSVAQELIGYKDGDIYNYSHGNIESWVDIHDFAEGGRLVFMSDSAGHPRYRRTVLRGLVGWDPHWTVLCVAGDVGNSAPATLPSGGQSSPVVDAPGLAGETIDFARAHLDLCLRLGSPLAVVITKLDLATRASLQRTVGKVLTSVKNAGRSPKIVHPDQKSRVDPEHVPAEDYAKIRGVVDAIGGYGNALSCVPILLASAVKGTGIGLIHALLASLPLPPKPTAGDLVGMALNPEQPRTLFHIDDTFSLSAPYPSLTGAPDQQQHHQQQHHQNDAGLVVTGYLRFGRLKIGDAVLVGPFPSDEQDVPGASSPGGGLSISHSSSSELARIAMRNAVSASTIKGEWHGARIVSVRNLRMPVLSLEAGQVGSVGVILDPPSPPPQEKDSSGPPSPEAPPPLPPRVRKGMVLAIPSQHMVDTGLTLQAASGLTASFSDPDVRSLAVGSLVNIYVASVRTAARVLRVSPPSSAADSPDPGRAVTEEIDDDDDDDVFCLNGQLDGEEVEDPLPPGPGPEAGGNVHLSLELLTNREWIEMGSRILVLEGGRQDKSGLEGYLGKVVEIVD